MYFSLMINHLSLMINHLSLKRIRVDFSLKKNPLIFL